MWLGVWKWNHNGCNRFLSRALSKEIMWTNLAKATRGKVRRLVFFFQNTEARSEHMEIEESKVRTTWRKIWRSQESPRRYYGERYHEREEHLLKCRHLHPVATFVYGFLKDSSSLTAKLWWLLVGTLRCKQSIQDNLLANVNTFPKSSEWEWNDQGVCVSSVNLLVFFYFICLNILVNRKNFSLASIWWKTVSPCM